MSKPVPRSRLNISYRTKIDGKPKKAKLPMRFLVLGDFTGANRRLLGERPIHSILPGMKLASFMDEMKVTAPIEDAELREVLAGALAGSVTGTLVGEPAAGATEAKVKIRGTATVKGDFRANRLGSFAGEVEISGEAMLPFANGELAIPDGGTPVKLSVHGKVEPPPGAEIGLTGDVHGEFEVTVGPNDSAATELTGGLKSQVSAEKVPVDLTIPLRSINDFKPLHVAMSVPEIRRIVLLHRLVLEARNHISSFPELREALKAELVQLREVPVAEGEKSAFGQLRGYFRRRYPLLVAEARPDAAAAPVDAAPDEPEPDAKALLERLISSAGMNPSENKQRALVERPGSANLAFHDRDTSFTLADRFANILAVLLVNIDPFLEGRRVDSIRTMMIAIDTLLHELDGLVQKRLAGVVQSPSLRALETSWRSLDDLCREVNSNEVIIDFLDADKEVLRADFEDHSSYILNSALFRKVYIDEYDRYGGRPIGVMIGLYEFDNSDEDIDWLQTVSKISAAAHCPFVAAVSPRFFSSETWEELDRKPDIEELMALPQYGRWAAFRETHGAAYIGLTMPRYMLRAPYVRQAGKQQAVDFEEKIGGPGDYLWGNAAVLFARNMVRSFQASGWCQHIAGPLGGGLIKGLPVHMVLHHGQEELQPPVEVAIPDYRELQLANAGFIPLVHCKGTADVTFFSARAVKRAIEFEDDLDTKNADLICNLAYTLSITRIAHYVKRMVRDYIGSTADAPYIQSMLEAWLVEYVTTAVNPDDLTLLYYPFKAMSVSVEPKPGPFGWYSCKVAVLPHIQFQGMDVELRLEAALGGA
ncbi:type VI secretion system contractile sheath large subunit [Nannocystis bainbridge]|uniref:Type VI secretion system contractile sheath large subunit n=1 Tax=Nannocystis bainbridge TaxID=2995303 RepID=A0ABT5ECG9_9BACT|nr:type VI secretion system contractile sheath large subunit [Nannocystis bainbridge]MDC0723566.1 type VI secretion system contractile sheath large subunit [Nannocystis bainbridge]